MDQICLQVSAVVAQLAAIGLVNATLDCDLATANVVLGCASLSADWTLQNGGVQFMPFAWAREKTTISEDDANNIKDNVYGAQASQLTCHSALSLIVAIC